MVFDTLALVRVIRELLAAPIRYDMTGLNGKVRPLTNDVGQISALDCSGFVQYVVYQATTANERIPMGSRRQRSHVQDTTAHIDYPTFAPCHDDTVRIGFRDAVWVDDLDGNGQQQIDRATGRVKRKRDPVGHVWLVINGRTYESTPRGGRSQGPKSLLWSARTADANHFFQLGTCTGFGAAMAAARLWTALSEMVP
ncbi:hypothetical protein DXV76_04135 [Rhodobacteraceae bacterium CCMM004]|nr:hypothetical protein DXV76_04135 [Rhodobacteraceae bacterium CCMM004]